MKLKHTFSSLAFLLATLQYQTNTKYVSCFIDEKSDIRWRFCSKMAFKADTQATLTVVGQLEDDEVDEKDLTQDKYLNLLIYKEYEWETQVAQFTRTKDCQDLQSYAYLNYPIPLQKNASLENSMKYYQMIQDITQVLFFAIADCEKRAFIGEDEIDFKIEMEILNDDQQFSEERRGMVLFYISAFFVFAIVLGVNVYKYVVEMFQYNKPETPMLILMMSATLQLAHIIFQLVHLVLFSYNGKGMFIFDIFSTLQQIISQIFMAFLFLLLAFGWTITKNSVGMEELDMIIPIACFVIVMHVIMGGLIFIDSEEHHKFHDYSGIQGLILCIFRILLFAGFIYGLRQTRKEIINDQKKLEYMRQMSISGTLYFLSLPVFYGLCHLLSPYNQQLFFIFTTFFTQLISYIILLYQFSAKKSKYYAASFKSESVLPHGKDF